MRNEFFEELKNRMAKDDRIWLLTADLGHPFMNDIRDQFPERFLNCGIAEQAMVGIAVGLANGGAIPFVYSITPFVLFKPFETIRNSLHHDRANVKIIASGQRDEYADHNYSHVTECVDKVLESLSNIRIMNLKSNAEIKASLEEAISNKGPYFISISRK